MKEELIGKEVFIVSSKNKSLEGIKGKIIDETKNTITIKTSSKIKKILKNQVKLELKIKNKIIKINGKEIQQRPEDRIKK